MKGDIMYKNLKMNVNRFFVSIKELEGAFYLLPNGIKEDDEEGIAAFFGLTVEKYHEAGTLFNGDAEDGYLLFYDREETQQFLQFMNLLKYLRIGGAISNQELIDLLSQRLGLKVSE
jgi:hypothetical protein